jgi:hypothetical protein
MWCIVFSRNQKNFARCKDYLELEKAAQAFIMVIEDGDMNEQQMALPQRSSYSI